MSEFYRYFCANMEALHLTAPHSLFGTAKQAKETIENIAKAITSFGANATMKEIFLTVPSMSILGDAFVLYEGVKPIYYLGACIGSLAVATGMSLSGGITIADFFEVADPIVQDRHIVQQAYSDYRHNSGR
jgi:hypothetical protein